MSIELAVKSDLDDAVQNILSLGNMESFASVEEILCCVFNFYGALTKAVEYCVITPEQAGYLHHWLVAMFELKY
jgi:hypothetical protein